MSVRSLSGCESSFPGRAGREYHVSPGGNDDQGGTRSSPFRTISAAAAVAMPGDVVTVHPGIYRERIDPPRGGSSEHGRITYRSAEFGGADIRGSEVIKGWSRVQGSDVWSVRVPNALFGDFNPYREPIRGHWFNDNGRSHSRGAVYLDGHWLIEADSPEAVGLHHEGEPLWHAEVDDAHTVIRAEFPGVDPNEACVEINVRTAVFYPSREGCDYITVRGFVLQHAATPWSPPTTEQVGLLGTNWSKGWLIEDNDVRYSICAGITLGKYHDPLDFPERDIVEGTGGEDTYHGTIRRALEHGWSIDSVGNHVVRNNTVSHCEMAGICGSMGAIRSVIENNVIHAIHVRRLFKGYEQAGIKFHAAIDTQISGNQIYNCNRGLWLDWMSQGTRVSRNIFYENGPGEDIFLEVNHGPFVIDNNLVLSPRSIYSQSQGGAYVHNFILGRFHSRDEAGRVTPFHLPHSTEVVEMRHITLGDDKILNNVFVDPAGLTDYDDAIAAVKIEGNLYLKNARPTSHEANPLILSAVEGSISVVKEDGRLRVDAESLRTLFETASAAPVTADRLGIASVPGLPYEAADGSPVRFDYDFEGNLRNENNCIPGPFVL